MSKTKVLAVLVLLASLPVTMFADIRQHIDRLEFGVSAGVGFYVGQDNPVSSRPDLLRVQSYDAIAFGERSTLKWPGIETFGFNVGYRFDTHWHLQLQTVRQRLCFAEYDIDPNTNQQIRGVYYNAMWHLDVMAEYDILNYGNVMMPKQKIYNVVPYVGFGLGVTMYNQNATLRSVNGKSNNSGKLNTFYPQVGTQYENGKKPVIGGNEIGAAMYVPMAVGIKWRINDNVQLKGTFQYQLYFASKSQGGMSANLEGATYANYKQMENRPTFDELDKYVAGKNHDCLFSVSAIFNFGKWYEDRLITY